jgi:dTDP-4-amino-4,6-dideoxygalactose transaminase
MTQDVRRELDDAWRRLVTTSDFIGGSAVARFESEWAAYCGVSRALGVANGTDAVQLALRAIGVASGDEVVVPANTFVATVEAVLLAGAVPRFADVDPRTLLLTPETISAAVTAQTKAIVVVHLFGQPADMDAIGAYAASIGAVVIEDAAQAHGARWKEKQAGSMGKVGCFSFYPGKNLGAFGDGGAVTTDDAEVAETIRLLRDHGRRPGSHYDHGAVGMNSRLDTLQAAVLSAKLKHLDRWTAARRRIMTRYREELEGPSIRFVAEAPGAHAVYHLAVIRVPARDQVRSLLATQGIATGIHYPTPCHRVAPYREFSTGRLPVTEVASDEILSLPLFPHMTDAQVARVCAAVRRAVAEVTHSRVA